jgi:hypothetical protein
MSGSHAALRINFADLRAILNIFVQSDRYTTR